MQRQQLLPGLAPRQPSRKLSELSEADFHRDSGMRPDFPHIPNEQFHSSRNARSCRPALLSRDAWSPDHNRSSSASEPGLAFLRLFSFLISIRQPNLVLLTSLLQLRSEI